MRLFGAGAAALAGTWVLVKIGQILFWIAVPAALVGIGIGLGALHRRLNGGLPVPARPALDTRAEEIYALDQTGVVDLLPLNDPARRRGEPRG